MEFKSTVLHINIPGYFAHFIEKRILEMQKFPDKVFEKIEM
jgi:hypothetical protein